MYENHRVGVVVPVYNEAVFVGDVLDGIPDFVDVAYAVDDCSTDRSWAVILERAVRAGGDGFDHERAPDTVGDIAPDGPADTPEAASAAASADPAAASTDPATTFADPAAASTDPATTFADPAAAIRPDSEQASADARSDVADTDHEETRRASDGGSTDGPRLVPIRHGENRGRGGAVKTGYRAALADGIDVVAVLDGDGQMDPTDLNRLLDPIVSGVADYAKGDRLRDSTHRREMSGWRLFGNALLTLLTRAASGYWGMSDPQNGFTAISRDALEDIEVDRLYEDYGFLNDVLVQLNVVGARVADVSMRARYGEEESGIQYRSFVPRLSWLLCRRFVWRLRVASTSSRRPVAPLYGLAALTALGGVGGSLLSVGAGMGDATPVALTVLVSSVVLTALAVAVDAHDNSPLVARLDLDRSPE